MIWRYKALESPVRAACLCRTAPDAAGTPDKPGSPDT
jgi:hypothetical protein